jgi:2-amino-4-hydroxy-6-hydroxymethyldihydropteridine diphosphokinase
MLRWRSSIRPSESGPGGEAAGAGWRSDGRAGRGRTDVPQAWVSIGSNIGDRAAYIARALTSLSALPDTEVTGVSSLYDTAPVGEEDQPSFLNAVAEISTDMEPVALMRSLLSIEEDCGRTREKKWGPRTLDLDLIIYDDVEMDAPELTLPHPRAKARAFVLIPLAEIAPELRFPGHDMTVSRMVEGLGDVGTHVRRVAGPPEL